MCGIIGVWRKEGVTKKDIVKLIELVRANLPRGPKAFGFVTPTTLFKSTNPPTTETMQPLWNCVGEEYVFIHLRAPTGNGQNTLIATQPLQGPNYTLLHNGILTNFSHSISDTYYMLNELENKGERFMPDEWILKTFEGCYSLVILNYSTIRLMRSISTLYYDDNFVSSVPFKDSKELPHGALMDFKTKEIEMIDIYTPYEVPK